MMKTIVATVVFFLLVGVFTFLHKPLQKKAIEADLREKVEAVLKKKGVSPQVVALDGHTLALDSRVGRVEGVEEKLDEIYGLYYEGEKLAKADQVGEAIPVVSIHPNLSCVEDKKGNIVLSGLVADEETRQNIVSGIRQKIDQSGQRIKIVDELRVSDGKESVRTFHNLPAFLSLAESLALEAEGARISYSGEGLKLGGLLSKNEQRDQLIADAQAVLEGGDTSGAVMSDLQVVPFEPLDFRVERIGEKISVSGRLPDSTTREKLLALVKAGAGESEVLVTTSLAKRPASSGECYWWKDHPLMFVTNFLKKSRGSALIHYKPDRLIVRGIYPEAGHVEEAKGQLVTIPKQISQELALAVAASVSKPVEVSLESPEEKEEPKDSPVAEVKPVSEPIAQPRVEKKQKPNSSETADRRDHGKKELQERFIYFDTGSITVPKEQRGKLKEIAKNLKSQDLKKQKVVISGYADYRGRADMNSSLSKERAYIVRNKLISYGLPAKQIQLRYFGEEGEDIPESDLWKSRRVEIYLDAP